VQLLRREPHLEVRLAREGRLAVALKQAEERMLWAVLPVLGFVTVAQCSGAWVRVQRVGLQVVFEIEEP
jgi:hypothetical protein